MPPTTRPLTLITGASGGIGADLARVFARHGHDLALVARDVAKLEALADEIAATGRPRPLVVALDLTAPGAAAQLVAALPREGAQVSCLVNNAGFGLLGDFDGADPAGQLGMVDLNISALVELTSAFLPQIRAAKGRILNVASIAAFLPGPGFAVYYATKAFVASFSAALGQELKGDGVTVSVLCPGLTASGFQARAGFDASLPLAKVAMMDAMSVAEAGYAGLMRGKRLIVPGFANKITVALSALIPRSLCLPIIAKLQKTRSSKTA